MKQFFTGKINVNEIFDFVKRLFIGTTSGLLMKAGIGFFGFGSLDVIIYLFDSYVMGKSVSAPGTEFGLMETVGSLLFVLGLIGKLYTSRNNNNQELELQRLELKENYKFYSHAKLQHEVWRLYKVKNASIVAIHNIFDHSDNQGAAIDLFTKAHLHLLPKDDWFNAKGSFLRTRYKISYVFWWLFPVGVLISLASAALEFKYPGLTQSGNYVSYPYLILSVLSVLYVIGGKVVYDEVAALGHADTLIRKYKP